MAASDMATVAFIYKRKYATEDQFAEIVLRDHALFQDISRQGGFTGEAFFYPIRYGNPQGISGDFATAQSNAASSKGKQLQASRKKKYGCITIDGEAIMACADKGAFVDLVRKETDGVLMEMGDRMAFDLYRDGTCVRGRRSSASSNVITLTVADDARNFKVGMTIEADDSALGTSPRSGTTTITAIDEDAGTITVASAAAISGFADNDYLFADGEGSTGVEGLEVCTPLTAPVLGADSFRGIDRGSDVRRLAGIRINDTSTNIEENIGLAAIRVSQIGRKQDKSYINPIKFWEVARRLNAKVEFDDAGGEGKYGFQYITVHTPAGVIKLVSDPDCPTTRAFGCRQDSHYIKHMGGVPHIINDDGNFNLRQASADGIEARARVFWNYIQEFPGDFSVIAIA